MDTTCENCGRVIGKLEQAYLFNGHVVCDSCRVRLESPRIDYAPAPAATTRAPLLIEQTGKAWKAIILAGILIWLAGVAAFAVLFPQLKTSAVALGCAAVIGFGLVIQFTGHVGAWWFHG